MRLLSRFNDDFDVARTAIIAELNEGALMATATGGSAASTPAATPATRRTAESPVGLSHKQILAILSGLLMGMFLAALDQTIVSTAIRTIADDLHGLSVQAWVTTAYLITSTIATPLYGKLSDIYGRKKFFIAAISIFIVGSMLCTLATSMYSLAAYRAFQGIGAGGLFTLALAIIGDIVSPRERARYQGYFLAVFGTSSVLGPVIGGFLAGQASILGISGWRWVFLVNVPIGIAALFVVQATLHIPHFRRDHRVDWWGAALLSIALVPAADRGRAGAHLGLGLGPLAGLLRHRRRPGSPAFIFAEWRFGDEALIPLRIFKNRTISLALISSVVTGAGLFGAVTVLPLYLQIVHGASPSKAGLLMLPFVLGLMSAAVISGPDHLQDRPLPDLPDHGRGPDGDRPGAAVAGALRHLVAGDHGVHAGDRLRARQHDAAVDARRTELGGSARHRGGHGVVDVLPADRRHAGRRGVPVHPVQHRRATRSPRR